jgi:hypothetical protein
MLEFIKFPDFLQNQQSNKSWELYLAIGLLANVAIWAAALIYLIVKNQYTLVHRL